MFCVENSTLVVALPMGGGITGLPLVTASLLAPAASRGSEASSPSLWFSDDVRLASRVAEPGRESNAELSCRSLRSLHLRIKTLVISTYAVALESIATKCGTTRMLSETQYKLA